MCSTATAALCSKFDDAFSCVHGGFLWVPGSTLWDLFPHVLKAVKLLRDLHFTPTKLELRTNINGVVKNFSQSSRSVESSW
jgi:hypothetical protein